MLLIVFSVTGWLQSFRVLNETPYVLGTAQQIVSMANLTRYALVTADPVYRPALLMVLAKKRLASPPQGTLGRHRAALAWRFLCPHINFRRGSHGEKRIGARHRDGKFRQRQTRALGVRVD